MKVFPLGLFLLLHFSIISLPLTIFVIFLSFFLFEILVFKYQQLYKRRRMITKIQHTNIIDKYLYAFTLFSSKNMIKNLVSSILDHKTKPFKYT